MTQSIGRVKRILGGLPYFSLVTLTLEPTPLSRSVELQLSGEGFRSQGHVEWVPAEGYEDWKEGAIRGARYALRSAAIDAAVTITEIGGLSTDTNPSIVALATALAIWQAHGTTPAPNVLDSIEAIAFASWAPAAPPLPQL